MQITHSAGFPDCLLVFPHFGSNFAPLCFSASRDCISVQVTELADVFPYKEAFHLSVCHHQTTVELGKPLGRMPGKPICIAGSTMDNL